MDARVPTVVNPCFAVGGGTEGAERKKTRVWCVGDRWNCTEYVQCTYSIRASSFVLRTTIHRTPYNMYRHGADSASHKQGFLLRTGKQEQPLNGGG